MSSRNCSTFIVLNKQTHTQHTYIRKDSPNKFIKYIVNRLSYNVLQQQLQQESS